jgi:hypothetical protein
MKVINFITALICSISASAQNYYRTDIMRDDIKSLEVKVAGTLVSNPLIQLGGEARIEIAFDALHQTGRHFTYSIYHCDADGNRSSLLPIEYMKGFQNTYIKDYANSIATTVNYTHYKLMIPNEEVQLLVSGNYAVVVNDDAVPDGPALIACFSVSEALLDMEATITGKTDTDFNDEHQQLEFTINYNKINIVFPQSELKISVSQNNNEYDVRRNLQPSFILNKQLRYNHNRSLIFTGGNEYRRVEFQSHRFNGMGVDNIRYFAPYYNVTLFPDEIRSRKVYSYDQDQNGRFFINCKGCNNHGTEGDYYVVHFSLTSARLSGGEIYIFGDIFHNIIDERSKMEYNAIVGAYEKAVLLKSGMYNYLYVFVSDDKEQPLPLTAPIEGNYYETENEYMIKVYYRPPGARYDRLIGSLRVGGV